MEFHIWKKVHQTRQAEKQAGKPLPGGAIYKTIWQLNLIYLWIYYLYSGTEVGARYLLSSHFSFVSFLLDLLLWPLFIGLKKQNAT